MTTYPRDRFSYSSPFTRPKLKEEHRRVVFTKAI
jgi:hypothetical protein